MESHWAPCQAPLTAAPEVPATGVWVPEIRVTDAWELSVMATELPFSAALGSDILLGPHQKCLLSLP